ncbi:class Ib ribonucleoside-diphosphate reductase assembly flavoprotein NrdI, partial [Erwinia amylovora]
MASLVYFSSLSENTNRFIARLNLPSRRIPLDYAQQLHVS